MAEAPLSLDIEYFPDPTRGRPVSNGSIYIGVSGADPEILANRVSVILIQEDNTRVTVAPASQPFTTGGGGIIEYNGNTYPVIRVSGESSVKVLDSGGTQVYYAPATNISASAAVNEGILVQNGSFEFETQAAGVPDNWALAAGSNGTIAIDSTDQAHGLKSLKVTGTDATGGGTATSEKFDVLAGSDLDIRATYKSSAVNTLNKVEIKYYDAANAAVSISTVVSEGAANPTSYAQILVRETVPATAIKAEIILTGVDGAGTVVVGSTNFDDVSASSLTENAVIRTTHTSAAVNEITAKDAATGGNVSLTATGDDANIQFDISSKGTNPLTLNGLSISSSGLIGDAAFATNTINGDKLVVGSVAGSQITSSSITRTQLSTTQSAVSFSIGASASIGQTLTGGGQHTWFTWGATGTGVRFGGGPSAAGVIGFYNPTGSAVTIDLDENYITTSPPWDLGDGEVNGFVYLVIDDTTGEVVGTSIGFDPVWAYNGPTNIIPTFIDADGRKYATRKVLTPEIRALPFMERAAAIRELKEETYEITQALKNADMDLIPHPFTGMDMTGRTVVLLDPMCDCVADLAELFKAGEPVRDGILKKGLLVVGNENIGRSGPGKILIPSVRWKRTGD